MIAGKGYGFACPVSEFLITDTNTIVGNLASRAAARLSGAVEAKQIQVWNETVEWLKCSLRECWDTIQSIATWTVCFEYEIPRRGSRIDAVLLTDKFIILIEFKSGKADKESQRQVEDYGLELVDFHADSHNREIFPIVCAGDVSNMKYPREYSPSDRVKSVTVTGPRILSATISQLYLSQHSYNQEYLVCDKWLNAAYEPTPTIIEAARALYSGHDVKDISFSQASAQYLERTEKAVSDIVFAALKNGEKAICFITGVPGAGKTLAGLNLVHRLKSNAKATFLSGNGPLVKVLQAALTLDLNKRQGVSKSEATRRATTSITNVHKWLDEYIDRSPQSIPNENVVVFDEAQRAWNRAHSKRKFGRDFSEPEMILRVMERHPDWAVLVALIGGGQEINTGEAGLAEWGRALKDLFPTWKISISPVLLTGDSSTAGSVLFKEVDSEIHNRLKLNPDLHLSVSQRSYRGVKLTEWVEYLLSGQIEKAAESLLSIPEYPIYLTRDLETARSWLKHQGRGLRQCGLVASSGAKRIRVYGLNVAEPIDAADWFLKPHDDVRSSNYLETPSTEFGIQGLELDWIGLAWGGDFRWNKNGWKFMQFRGTKWQEVKSKEQQQYMVNKYRVLLTRARQGLVIWVPYGNDEDPTRSASIYDPTFDYLKSCNIPEL